MAGYAEEGQDTTIPGGITNLTELLGGTEADKDKGLDNLGLPVDLKTQPTPRGPGIGLPTKGAASGGLSLGNAMNQKTVIAQINHVPASELQGATGGGDGIPNLQTAMTKKAVSRKNSEPAPPPPLPNKGAFSRHSSLPGITVVPPDASGGATLEQVTSGKGGIPKVVESQEGADITKAALGISLQQAMSGKGLSPEGATGGKELPAVTPPNRRKAGVGMMLDQGMAKQGVTPMKMGHSVSVDEALSSLAKPKPSASPAVSPRRASMAPLKVTFEDEVSPRKALKPVKAPLNLQQAMESKTGQQAKTRKQSSGGMNLREAMAAKTGQPQKRGYDSVDDAMAAKQGKKQAFSPRLMKPLPDLPPVRNDRIFVNNKNRIKFKVNRKKMSIMYKIDLVKGEGHPKPKI